MKMEGRNSSCTLQPLCAATLPIWLVATLAEKVTGVVALELTDSSDLWRMSTQESPREVGQDQHTKTAAPTFHSKIDANGHNLVFGSSTIEVAAITEYGTGGSTTIWTAGLSTSTAIWQADAVMFYRPGITSTLIAGETNTIAGETFGVAASGGSFLHNRRPLTLVPGNEASAVRETTISHNDQTLVASADNDASIVQQGSTKTTLVAEKMITADGLTVGVQGGQIKVSTDSTSSAPSNDLTRILDKTPKAISRSDVATATSDGVENGSSASQTDPASSRASKALKATSNIYLLSLLSLYLLSLDSLVLC